MKSTSSEALLSLTPCLSGVGSLKQRSFTRFNGFQNARTPKPLKRFQTVAAANTLLKQGVNETGQAADAYCASPNHKPVPRSRRRKEAVLIFCANFRLFTSAATAQGFNVRHLFSGNSRSA